MDVEKLKEMRLNNPMTYKEAFDRVMSATDKECRLMLFGLLMGFSVGETIREIEQAENNYGRFTTGDLPGG